MRCTARIARHVLLQNRTVLDQFSIFILILISFDFFTVCSLSCLPSCTLGMWYSERLAFIGAWLPLSLSPSLHPPTCTSPPHPSSLTPPLFVSHISRLCPHRRREKTRLRFRTWTPSLSSPSCSTCRRRRCVWLLPRGSPKLEESTSLSLPIRWKR